MFNGTEDVTTSDAYENAVFAAALVYGFLTVFGIFGNCLVIFVILRILFCSTGFIQVYIYTLSLSLVDLTFFLSAPFIIINMVSGEWLFDIGICKLMFICEGLNKGLSVYLLTVLTGDRFLAVCFPLRSQHYRTPRASLIAVMFCCGFVILANAPLYIYSELTEIRHPATPNLTIKFCHIDFPLFESSNVSLTKRNGTDQAGERQSSIWERFQTYYTLFMLAFYHIIPGGLIVVFSALIHRKVRHSIKKLHKRSSNKGRVTRSIFSVVIFYFSCWTPFWLLQIFIVFMGLDNKRTEVLYSAVVLYGLPYLNSAINPILYTFLNKNLRKTYGNAKEAGKRKDAVKHDRYLAVSGLNTTEFDNSPAGFRRKPRAYQSESLLSANGSLVEKISDPSEPKTRPDRLATVEYQKIHQWSHSLNGHLASHFHTAGSLKDSLQFHSSQTI